MILLYPLLLWVGVKMQKIYLSPEIRFHLSKATQPDFIASYKKAVNETKDETKAKYQARSEIKDKYAEDGNGIWSKAKAAV